MIRKASIKLIHVIPDLIHTEKCVVSTFIFREERDLQQIQYMTLIAIVK